MAKTPMTTRGAELLRAELHRLKTVDRPNVITAIAEARAHGDLSENAEYDAAVEESGFLAGRVEEMKALFVGVQIIEPRSTVEGIVTIGKTVRLRQQHSQEEVVYKIVGGGSVDTDNGEVSFFAPLGKALISRQKGDRVTIDLPGGRTAYEVLEITFSD
jgi:transcription elongation factor GreA